MTLTGVDFFRMLYLMGADRGEDVKGEYEDSFIDDDEVEGESQQTYSSTLISCLIQSLRPGHATWDAEREQAGSVLV